MPEVKAFAAVSPVIELEACMQSIERRENRIYEWNFCRNLQSRMRRKARAFPELVPRYRALYGRGSYLPKAYQQEVAARVRMAGRRHGLPRAERTDHRRLAGPAPQPPPEQLALL